MAASMASVQLQCSALSARRAAAPPRAALCAARGRVAPRATRVVTRAALPELLFQLAEVGDVDAPVGAIAGGAFVVTALGLGSTFFFKSGFEAQEEMREREKNVFGKNTLPKSKPPPKRR